MGEWHLTRHSLVVERKRASPTQPLKKCQGKHWTSHHL